MRTGRCEGSSRTCWGLAIGGELEAGVKGSRGEREGRAYRPLKTCISPHRLLQRWLLFRKPALYAKQGVDLVRRMQGTGRDCRPRCRGLPGLGLGLARNSCTAPHAMGLAAQS